MRKPFYRKQTKCWYVKDSAGRFIRLDPDEEQAFLLWHQMLEAGRKKGDPNLSVLALASKYLSEQEQLISEKRFKLITHYVGEFSAAHAKTRCSELTKGIVVKWSKSQATWGAWARHDAIAVVKSLFLWGERESYIDRSPLRNLKNPKPQSRKRVLTESEHAALIREARSNPEVGKDFALLLIASRCGARPQQLREVEAHNVFGDRWIFDEHKTKHQTQKALTVYLTPCVATLAKIMGNRTGHLFTRADGVPWDKDEVSKRMRTLREAVGLDDEVVPYTYRHTFATNALLAGLSSAEVAELLGHTDSRMVQETYGHLDKAPDHMVAAAARASKKTG